MTPHDTTEVPNDAVPRIEAGLIRWALDVLENGQTISAKGGEILLDEDNKPMRATATPAVAEVCRKLLSQLRPIQKERDPVKDFLNDKKKMAQAVGGKLPPVDMDGQDRAVQ